MEYQKHSHVRRDFYRGSFWTPSKTGGILWLKRTKDEQMAASSKLMIAEAERRFPIRVRVAVPVAGFGQRLTQIHGWLDENCGADGWLIAPSGRPINDAIAIYFLEASHAAAFVVRWCQRSVPRVEEGAFRVRDDAPQPRRSTPLHRTP